MAEREVYHILALEEWDAAQKLGAYRPASVDAQGFVHCSTREQVLDTANGFFRGRAGLVLLAIDTTLLAAELRYEPGDMPGHEEGVKGLFPHLYGTLNLEAVTRVLPFAPTADGMFVLPEALSRRTADGPSDAVQNTDAPPARQVVQVSPRQRAFSVIQENTTWTFRSGWTSTLLGIGPAEIAGQNGSKGESL